MQDGWVRCNLCGANGPRQSSDDDAITAWNRRPIEISEEMVERGRLAAVAFAKEEQGNGFRYIADAPHERAIVRRVLSAALGTP